MTKSELKPGYIVKYRDGNLRLVMPKKETGCFLIQMGTENPLWHDLNSYEEDLTNKNFPEMTIVEVYGRSSYEHTALKFNKKHRELLWKSSEKKKYTYAQLREILGEEFEVVG